MWVRNGNGMSKTKQKKKKKKKKKKMLLYVTIFFLSLAFLLRFFLHKKTKKKFPSTGVTEEPKKKKQQQQQQQQQQPKEKKEEKKEAKSAKKSKGAPEATHQLLIGFLAGHQGEVDDIDLNGSGRYVASCARDRTLRIWRRPEQGETPNYIRINMEYNGLANVATAVGFSKNRNSVQYLAVALGVGQTKPIQIYGIHSKPKLSAELLHTFDTTHTEEIRQLKFASDASFIVSSTKKGDTKLLFWTPKGELLHSVQTNQLANNNVMLSSNDRFLTAATAVGGPKIFEIIRDKETKKKITRVEHVMSLSSHNKALPGVSFGPDGETVATISLDGTWRLWNINVRYQVQEDPKKIYEGNLDSKETPGVIAVRPIKKDKNLIVALSVGMDIRFYHQSGKLLNTIESAHKGGVPVLLWTPDGKYLVSTGGDKSVKVWSTSFLD